MQIHTIPEYENLVEQVSDKEYDKLKKSIEEDGLHYPIAVNEDGVVLDGHHRRRVCIELGIPLKYNIMRFANILLEKKFVIVSNLKRRQLSDYQKLKYARDLEEIYKELTKQRQEEGRKEGAKEGGKTAGRGRPLPLQTNDRKGNSKPKKKREKTAEELAAEDIGWSGKTLQRAKRIEKEGTQEEKKLLEEGKKKVGAIVKKIETRQKNEELKQQAAESQPKEDKNSKFLEGEFVERTKELGDNSIDLIFTDPPYGKDSISIYGRLAEVAQRILKKGGSLIAYTGQYTLPEVLDELRNAGLKYYWTLCIHHPGNKSRAHQRDIFIDWKPLLWFVKGDKPNVVNEAFSDYMESKRDKENYEWQQDVDNAEYIISKLTVENQLVLDPMLGVGTTGIAARKLNRQFIGIEKDPDRLQIAKAKINQ